MDATMTRAGTDANAAWQVAFGLRLLAAARQHGELGNYEKGDRVILGDEDDAWKHFAAYSHALPPDVADRVRGIMEQWRTVPPSAIQSMADELVGH